jgi:hypothetical protein
MCKVGEVLAVPEEPSREIGRVRELQASVRARGDAGDGLRGAGYQDRGLDERLHITLSWSTSFWQTPRADQGLVGRKPNNTHLGSERSGCGYPS